MGKTRPLAEKIQRAFVGKKEQQADNVMRFVTILYLYENKYLHHHFTRCMRFVIKTPVQNFLNTVIHSTGYKTETLRTKKKSSGHGNQAEKHRK